MYVNRIPWFFWSVLVPSSLRDADKTAPTVSFNGKCNVSPRNGHEPTESNKCWGRHTRRHGNGATCHMTEWLKAHWAPTTHRSEVTWRQATCLLHYARAHLPGCFVKSKKGRSHMLKDASPNTRRSFFFCGARSFFLQRFSTWQRALHERNLLGGSGAQTSQRTKWRKVTSTSIRMGSAGWAASFSFLTSSLALLCLPKIRTNNVSITSHVLCYVYIIINIIYHISVHCTTSVWIDCRQKWEKMRCTISS